MSNQNSYLINKAIWQRSIDTLQKHSILLLTGEPATETEFVAQSIIRGLNSADRPSTRLLAAPRYATPNAYADARGRLIWFQNITADNRYDLNDFLWSAAALQQLIDNGNTVFITLSRAGYNRLLQTSKLGEWPLAQKAVIHLNPETDYDANSLSHWLVSRVKDARRDLVINSRQKRFLASSQVSAAVTDQLPTPRLLNIFVNEFASALDVRDPEFEADFEDVLHDVHHPDIRFTRWYAQLSQSAQVFLQVLLFLADSNSTVIRSAYHDVIINLRHLIPNLANASTGLLLQETGKVVIANPTPDFAPTFEPLTRRVVINNSYESLLTALPIFHELALTLPQEMDSTTKRRVRKGIAYGLATAGAPAYQIINYFKQWLENSDLLLKESAAFGAAVLSDVEPGSLSDVLSLVDAFAETKEQHIRYSAIQLAAAVDHLAPERARDALIRLAEAETESPNQIAIAQAAARLCRVDLMPGLDVMHTVATKVAPASAVAQTLVTELDEMSPLTRFSAEVLSRLQQWTNSEIESLRWLGATVSLKATPVYGINTVVDTLLPAYAAEHGGQAATVNLLLNENTAPHVEAVLRQLITVGNPIHNSSVAQILGQSATTQPAPIRTLLKHWTADRQEAVRQAIPYLLHKLVEPHQTAAATVHPFATPADLFELIDQLRVDESVTVRTNLANHLTTFAAYGGDHFFATASAFNQEAETSLRTAALNALREVRQLDPTQAITSTAAFQADADEAVRLATLPILDDLAASYPNEVMDTAVAVIADESTALKTALSAIIFKAAQELPVRGLGLLAQLITDATVADVAVPHFVSTTKSHWTTVNDSLGQYITHPNLALRLATIKALHEQPKEAHPRVAALVDPTITDEDTAVKLAVIRLMDQIYPNVPQHAATILSRLVLDPSVSQEAEQQLTRVLETSFAHSKDSLTDLARVTTIEAHMAAARISDKLASKFPAQIMLVLQILSADHTPELMEQLLSTLTMIGNIEPEAALHVLANIISGNHPQITQQASALATSISATSHGQVFGVLSQLVRDPVPQVRNMAISGLGTMPPKLSRKVISVLAAALPADTDRTNKLDGLRVLDDRSHYRLLDSAQAIALLCLDYDIGETATRQYAMTTRMAFERDQNPLMALAFSGKWSTGEIYQSFSWTQFMKFMWYRVLSEFQR